MSDRVIQTERKKWWKGDALFVVVTIMATLSIAWGMARYDKVSRAKKAALEKESKSLRPN